MYRRMDKDSLSEAWACIRREIERVVKKVSKLPEQEQDEEFWLLLEEARLHAESREIALIDPS